MQRMTMELGWLSCFNSYAPQDLAFMLQVKTVPRVSKLHISRTHSEGSGSERLDSLGVNFAEVCLDVGQDHVVIYGQSCHQPVEFFVIMNGNLQGSWADEENIRTELCRYAATVDAHISVTSRHYGFMDYELSPP
ncbi:hypothetical protein chiPu_0016796 [Chiloscyllium punctatum]|uniref:Uncharacterized protein n=1 Tax=Chiloscyllium punctatum TaxID=137246 RepID=A0A401T6N6_CHIPU|nr:hypothetical protein [Chiloscyllium punctatum]